MIRNLFFLHLNFCCYPTAARLSSVSLADFFARQDFADFLIEALLDFLAVGFVHSVCNILSYLNVTNLPNISDIEYSRADF
jgi:hypothetical protein